MTASRVLCSRRCRLPVRVIGAPEKKPKTVRKRDAEPPRREGMLPD
jgi:hypothetical protein